MKRADCFQISFKLEILLELLKYDCLQWQIFVPLEMIDLSPPAAPKLLVSPRLMEIYLCKKGKVTRLCNGNIPL